MSRMELREEERRIRGGRARTEDPKEEKRG
jgi:hypothetical protein